MPGAGAEPLLCGVHGQPQKAGFPSGRSWPAVVFSQAQMDAIHLPIGLDIGGETPAEIAVSVTAQLIQVRSGRLGRWGGGPCPA